MEYTLPPLSYAYDALEPHIDAQTMEIHYTKHHQTYVDKLNEALVSHPDLQVQSLSSLLQQINTFPQKLATAIRNHGGGHYNHTFFWTIMGAQNDSEPTAAIANAIKRTFGSVPDFQKQFTVAALSVFGSGWAWLCKDAKGHLHIITTPNQDSPIMQGMHPILGLDVWEHAYYLKYHQRRADYIANWWKVVQWSKVEQYYHNALFTL